MGKRKNEKNNPIEVESKIHTEWNGKLHQRTKVERVDFQEKFWEVRSQPNTILPFPFRGEWSGSQIFGETDHESKEDKKVGKVKEGREEREGREGKRKYYLKLSPGWKWKWK